MDKIDLIQPCRSLYMTLAAFGIWYFKSKWFILYQIYGFVLHLFGSYILTFCMWVNFLNTESLAKLADSLFMTLTETTTCVKMCNLLYHGKKLTILLKNFENEIFQPKTAEELEYIKQSNKFFLRIKYFYLGSATSCITAGFLSPFFDLDYKLPFPLWLPFDWKQSETYWYAYGYEIFSMTLTCFTNATLDMVHAYVIHQIQFYYKLIGLRFSKLGYDKTTTQNNEEYEREVTKKIINGINEHQFIRKLAKDVEQYVTLPIFIQTSVSAVVICVTAYQIQSLSPVQKTGEFLMLIYFLITMSSQIFFPCYFGHLLIINSESLTNSIFNSNWYNRPLKYKKLQYIFMEVLKPPMVITAEGFFPINLGSFTATMRSAYSLLAVLLNVNQK